MDDRLAAWAMGEERAAEANVEKAGGKIVFWLIMLFAFAPQLLGAVILIVIAWAVAGLVRMLVSRGLKAAKLDERVAEEREEGAEQKPAPLTGTLGEAAYWLVFLLFLPAILGTLSLGGLLQPVQSMLDKALSFFPNIATAALIGLVGWFVARIVQRIVTNLLAAVGADRLSDSVGLNRALGSQKLSQLVGLIAYILVLVPVIIAALNALQLEAVSGPASNMLNLFLEAIPAIFAAALVIAIGFGLVLGAVAIAVAVAFGVGGRHIAARELEKWVDSLKSEEQ